MKKLVSLVIVAVATSALAADQWKINPFTGKQDLIASLPLICDGLPGADSTVPGPAGPGVPPGGTDGQILTKKGFSNYSTHWAAASTTVNWGNITGNIADQPDINATFEPKNTNIQAHISNTSNPHVTTASQTGAEPYLGNPPEDGMIPNSTALGVRGWTHAGSMGQGAILTEIATSADGMTLLKRQGPTEADSTALLDVQKRDGAGGFNSVLKTTATGVEIRGTLTIY